MKIITAREIVNSIGMCNIPEYYSGRAALWSDMNGNHIYGIYRKIRTEIGTNAAEAFVTMVENLSYLSVSNFLNALYALEARNWVYAPFEECAVVARGRNDTICIKNTFFSKIGKYSSIKILPNPDKLIYLCY